MTRYLQGKVLIHGIFFCKRSSHFIVCLCFYLEIESKVEAGIMVTAFFISGMGHQKKLPENWVDILKTTNKVYLH